MAIKTPGSLGILQYVKETNYGQTPNPATMKALGFMRTGTADQKDLSEDMGKDGSRVTGSSIKSKDVAFITADLTLFATQDGHVWTDILPLAIGDDLKGVNDVPSASYLVKVAKDQFFKMNGGMFDKLTITADKVGGVIVGKVDIKGQILSKDTEKIADFPEAITEASVINTPMIYNSYPKVIDGTTEKVVPSHKFSYTFANALTAQPGFVQWYEETVASASGNGFVPGTLGITLEFEVTSVDGFWDNKKLGGWKGLTIQHLIGGKTLKFLDCEMESGLPSRSQQVYNETLSFKCHGGIEVV